jgi:hypothetical protein
VSAGSPVAALVTSVTISSNVFIKNLPHGNMNYLQ